jgi:hypothetical protein
VVDLTMSLPLPPSKKLQESGTLTEEWKDQWRNEKTKKPKGKDNVQGFGQVLQNTFYKKTKKARHIKLQAKTLIL